MCRQRRRHSRILVQRRGLAIIPPSAPGAKFIVTGQFT
jgi:hypothetical protein